MQNQLYRVRAFTLIELLIVISIIVVLIGLLLPALGSARKSAEQLRGESGLRQILLGYAMYRRDYNGRVLYGYTPATINGEAVMITTPSGQTFGLPIADRYPWRLAPYVDNVWEILHSHETVPPLPQSGDSDSDAMMKAYMLSISPTFGINSIYVGGHGDGPYKGFVTIGGVTKPNTGKHVVFREDEVRRPAELIVFSDSQARGGPFTDPQTGLYFVTPPYANGHRWRAVGDALEILMPGHITGLPLGRYSPAAITGFFDGHVAAMKPGELDDMRLWANGADTPDYDFRR